MFRFNDLPIAKKLALALGIVLVSICVIAALAILGKRHALMQEKEAALRHEVETVMGILEAFHAQQQAGQLDEQQARAAAYALVSKLRYDGNNYFMLSDSETGVVVMHPFRQELVGAPLGTIASATTLTQIAAAAHQSPEGGFVRYATVKPGAAADSPQYPKLTFTKCFEPWHLVASTGIYTDDVDAAARSDALGFALATLVLMGATSLVFVAIGRSISRPLRRALLTAEAIADGRLDTRSEARSEDEAGQLLRSMGIMQASLQRFVDAQTEMARQHDLGQTSYRIPQDGLPGVYGVMAGTMNDVAAAHINMNARVVEVVKSYARGDFSARMDRLPGEKAEVSAAMDEVKASFAAINEEVVKLVEAALAGDFAARGSAERYEHDFRRMVDGLNRLMEVSHTGLNEVARVLSAIARGDLTEEITSEYRGTFGQLKDDSNRTVEQLAAIVGQIRSGTETLNMAAREIAAGNVDLSGRTEQQAASLEETASAMEQLTATVRQNAASAREANQLAIGASEVARKGGGVVHEVVATMNSINESSKKIVEIISVIDGIAFQTNILALNAAVEAARAGDQGRGFAVVATEVRSLAQRSAAAAKEIKGLIGDSVAKVQSGTKLVDVAGATMEDIEQAVKRVTDIIAQIAAASGEQSSGIEQVNRAITQMDQTTHQNAALVEEAAAAAASMQQQAEALAQSVAVFKTEAVPGGRAGLPGVAAFETSRRAGTAIQVASPQGVGPAMQKPSPASLPDTERGTRSARPSPAGSAPKSTGQPSVERRGKNRAKNVARLPASRMRAKGPAAADAAAPKATPGAADDWAEF